MQSPVRRGGGGRVQSAVHGWMCTAPRHAPARPDPPRLHGMLRRRCAHARAAAASAVATPDPPLAPQHACERALRALRVATSRGECTSHTRGSHDDQHAQGKHTRTIHRRCRRAISWRERRRRPVARMVVGITLAPRCRQPLLVLAVISPRAVVPPGAVGEVQPLLLW
jgi:hypothetical protein